MTQSILKKRSFVSLTNFLPIMSFLPIMLLGVLLSGCVTTGLPGDKIDKEKGLQSHIQLGLNYIRKNNRDLARHHFTKALEIDKNSPGANNGFALLYQMDSEYKLAEKHFLRAIRSDRSFSQAQNNYGAFLFSRKRYKEARKAFKSASEDLSYTRRPSSLANLGRTELMLGERERARSLFEHALSLDSNLTEALIELADLSFQEKEFEKAKKYLDQFSKVGKATARSLWLGVRIERTFGNKDKEASYAIALKNLHQYSKEYLEYKKQKNN